MDECNSAVGSRLKKKWDLSLSTSKGQVCKNGTWGMTLFKIIRCREYDYCVKLLKITKQKKNIVYASLYIV